MNQITLKRTIESKTFGLSYPKSVPLEYEIMGGKLYVKHPSETHSFKVALENIENVISPTMYKSSDIPPLTLVDKDYIAYIPAFATKSSEIYTIGDFMKLVKGDFNKAQDLWNRCETELPETLIEA